MVLATALFCAIRLEQAPTLQLPLRPPNALGGEAFAIQITSLPPEQREDRIFREVMSGNVPDFLRTFVPVPVSSPQNTVKGTIFVAPDYLAVGSDADYFYVPMTPFTAQRIADKLHCLLPTPKISDSIYEAAKVQLTPSPIKPGPAMITVPVFLDHTKTVTSQRKENPVPLGALTAGDKKDIVICKALADTPGHVAIYGWHKPDHQPIQPLYLGHIATWADYSHGVRLIADTMLVDGTPRKVADVLRDQQLSSLLSSEGPIAQPHYAFHHFPRGEPWTTLPAGEHVESFSPFPGVRALMDSTSAPMFMSQTELVIYALPNGNTIEQTFGRRKDPDDDWHYDIQQIAAQTRFVREQIKDRNVVIAYLEASGHAWPAWIRAHDPAAAKTIVENVRARLAGGDSHVTLDSHSGGGALLFAYIKAVDAIPAWIDRIAFLDSEYNYDRDTHEAKLAAWLRDTNHYLCAIAYDDASARLNGKPFVTPEGGTWGRTHSMLADLRHDFDTKRVGDSDPERYTAESGRITFLLKENPQREIFHTVQVERNGFIESLLSGTSSEERSYRYFGRRAYSRLISN